MGDGLDGFLNLNINIFSKGQTNHVYKFPLAVKGIQF